MPFYEITYETGRSSVAYYEDDDEAKSAIQAHHTRAVNGEVGGPPGFPAERIKVVRVYKKHPDDYNVDQSMSEDVALKEIGAIAKSISDENGVLHIGQLAQNVQGLSHPMVSSKESSFDSNFKMKEDRELKWEAAK